MGRPWNWSPQVHLTGGNMCVIILLEGNTTGSPTPAGRTQAAVWDTFPSCFSARNKLMARELECVQQGIIRLQPAVPVLYPLTDRTALGSTDLMRRRNK